MKTSRAIILVFAVLAAGDAAIAAELASAQSLLDRVSADRNKANSATNSTDAVSTEIRQGLTNLISERAKLAAPEATTRWLSLADRIRTNSQAKAPINFGEALHALPEPPAWAELKKLLEKRDVKTASDLGLRVIAARLVNRTDEALVAIDAFAKTDEGRENYVLNSLRDEFARSKNQTPESLLKQLDRLAAASARGEASSQLELPQLRPTLSEEEATEALKKVLPKIKAPLSFRREREANYVWKAALAVVDQLPIAQWALVQSPAAAPLYEALEKKFPINNEDGDDDAKSERFRDNYLLQEAQRNYLIALIAKGDTDKAIAFARKNRKTNFYFGDANDEIPAANLVEFALGMIKQDPSERWWHEAYTAAAQAGLTSKVLKLAEESLGDPKLTQAQRATLNRVVYRAKLADDQVDEALKSFTDVANEQEGEEPAQDLAFLGAALKRPDLMTRAITVARAQNEKNRNTYGGYGGSQLPLLLARHGLPQEALDLAASSLTTAPRQGMELLRTIATIYIEQGRPAEALTLLEKSPDWQVQDIAATLHPTEGLHFGYRVLPLPLGYITAAALAGAGRQAEALDILKVYLRVEGGNDRAYELLLKLAGENATATLDELFALDRFEERPLIWKAVLQQKAGNLDAAEKTIRDAIAIDPSDGEQGPGDRLRAYAVLADIRAAKGDQKEAEFLRRAVSAIRLSEEADLDYAAGLLKRAIRKYRESLNLFADAYCVQARLAVQMSALGFNEEAEQHYRRAFELMPDSFGRVESHCFGCERAFGGPKAQGVAEKVFTDLLQKNPQKPQLHYLMGYLRQQQGRFEEAATNYQQAVALDADYLNAWKMLAQLSEEVKMTPEQLDSAALNLLRLDPAGRHGGAHAEVNDLAKLWDAVKAASDRIPEPPASLFKLTASAAEQEKLKSGAVGQLGWNHGYATYDYSSRSGLSKNPANAIARDRIITAAAQMVTSGSRFTE